MLIPSVQCKCEHVHVCHRPLCILRCSCALFFFSGLGCYICKASMWGGWKVVSIQIIYFGGPVFKPVTVWNLQMDWMLFVVFRTWEMLTWAASSKTSAGVDAQHLFICNIIAIIKLFLYVCCLHYLQPWTIYQVTRWVFLISGDNEQEHKVIKAVVCAANEGFSDFTFNNNSVAEYK